MIVTTEDRPHTNINQSLHERHVLCSVGSEFDGLRRKWIIIIDSRFPMTLYSRTLVCGHGKYWNVHEGERWNALTILLKQLRIGLQKPTYHRRMDKVGDGYPAIIWSFAVLFPLKFAASFAIEEP